MEITKTWLSRSGDFLKLAVIWIVVFGRRYPLLPAFYLLFFGFSFFQFANHQELPPPLPESSVPTSAATPSSAPALPSYAPTAASPASPSPILPIAQAQAFKSEGNVTLRWNVPVINPKLYADGALLPASCQFGGNNPNILQTQSCTAPISSQVTQIKASWEENGQSFEKNFRL